MQHLLIVSVYSAACQTQKQTAGALLDLDSLSCCGMSVDRSKHTGKENLLPLCYSVLVRQSGPVHWKGQVRNLYKNLK